MGKPQPEPAKGPPVISSQPTTHAMRRTWIARWQRWRAQLGPRALGILLALAIEALLVLMIVLIGLNHAEPTPSAGSIASFDVQGVNAEEQAPAEEPPPSSPTPQARAAETPTEEDLAPPPPELPAAVALNPTGPLMIEVPPDQMADLDISNLPRRRPDAPTGRSYGPSAPSSSSGDSQVVGTMPNGEPLYGARWYREPSQQELRGYLSTADIDSWALIACRTASDYRVEDCIGLEEYPQGSNMLRAVLAAAWQFEVRPPRRGNTSLVGSWVRIRIDYTRASGRSR